MRHTEKNRYRSQTTAIAAALRRSKRGGVRLRIYKCDHCTGWHLTSWKSARPWEKSA